MYSTSKLRSVTWCGGFACAALLALGALGASAAEFVPVKANFTGIFSEDDDVWQQSAGYIIITTTATGKYSGKLYLGANKYSFSGYFDATGAAANVISRRNYYPLDLQFAVDLEDQDIIAGSIADRDWVAYFYADKNVFDGRYTISPDAGQYTLLIPGDFTYHTEPGGASYGTVTVNNAGRLKFAGSLSDGTKVTQSTYVSKQGLWPLYLSLYRGNGAFYSWMELNPNTEEELVGDVTWIKLGVPRDRYYPGGFAIGLEAWGSRYFRPARGQKIIEATSLTVEWNGGNPVQALTNSVVLDSNNRIINQSFNPLTLKFSTSNGLFTGKVRNLAGEWLSFKGAVVQGYALGGGYFLGRNESGEVWMQPPEEGAAMPAASSFGLLEKVLR